MGGRRMQSTMSVGASLVGAQIPSPFTGEG